MDKDVSTNSEIDNGNGFSRIGKSPSAPKDSLDDLRSREESLNSGMSSSERSTDRLNILVVDDNPNNLLITTKLAEHLGYNVQTVNNGLKALDALSQTEFQIVLMDIRMAPIDGIETSDRIRKGEAGERGKETYIIALTAHALEGDRDKCLSAGMNDYLSKPLNLDQLNRSLKRAEKTILAS